MDKTQALLLIATAAFLAAFLYVINSLENVNSLTTTPTPSSTQAKNPV